MSPPLILIEDWSSVPAVTTRYIQDDNDLDLEAVYSQIKSLLAYPKCPHRPFDDTWPCTPCETAFLETYWTSAAHLLDYFADFLASDTPLMQSVWFHLLDVWQEAATFLPYDAVIQDAVAVPPRILWCLRNAMIFRENFTETLDLIRTTIFTGKRKNVPSDPIIHAPSGEATCPAGEYDTGPWISGLKPWQQFLLEGAPGVASTALDDTQDGDSEKQEGGQHSREITRHLPMAGISLIQKHTSRARNLATKLAHQQEEDPDDITEVLNTFDHHTLTFPTTPLPQSYTSSLTGQTITYRLANGAPPIYRYPGLGDPSTLVENPDFNLLDECVGVCKGVEAYEPVAGEQGQDGDEDEEAFDMWSVSETKAVGRGGGGENALARGFGEMFEEWCGDVEF